MGSKGPRADADAARGAFDNRLIAPMILGAVLNPVNSSIIAVSLIPIGIAFGAPPSQTAWLVSSLYLATAIGQPVVGRFVDLYGPRRLYLIGTSLVGVAGIIGLVAPSLGVLVGARVLLGFGTCSGYPAAMYLIRREAERTGHDSPASVLTTLTVSSQTIAVIGPTLGGLLIGVGGWRSTFAINIPLSIACLILGARRLPRGGVVEDARGRRGIDLVGIVLFAGMLVPLLLFLMSPRADDAFLPAITLAAAAGLVVRERRVDEPFIDVRVLAGNVPLVATYMRNLLAMTVSYGFIYGYTQWLEDGRGLTAAQAGLVLLPMFLTGVIIATITGRRREIRIKLLVGAIGQVVATSLLLGAGSGSAIWLLIVIAATTGIPQGLISLANQNAVYFQAEPERMGSSAGLLRTFMYLGAIVASAATGAVFPRRADTAGLHHLAIFLLAVAVLLTVVTVADRSLRTAARASRSSAENSSSRSRRP